jgi:hypothetical protein
METRQLLTPIGTGHVSGWPAIRSVVVPLGDRLDDFHKQSVNLIRYTGAARLGLLRWSGVRYS